MTRSSEPLILTDAVGRIVQVNAAWVELCGYSLDEVKGQTCAILQGVDTDAEAVKLLNASIRRGEHAEATLVNYKNPAKHLDSRFINNITIRPFYSPAEMHVATAPAQRRPSTASVVLGALQRKLSFGLGSAGSGGLAAAVSPTGAEVTATGPVHSPAHLACHFMARLVEVRGV